VVLLYTAQTETNAAKTKQALEELHAETTVEIQGLELGDPTDYGAILRQLRAVIRALVDEEGEAEFYISVASGTPQMHANCAGVAGGGVDVPVLVLGETGTGKEGIARLLHQLSPRAGKSFYEEGATARQSGYSLPLALCLWHRPHLER